MRSLKVAAVDVKAGDMIGERVVRRAGFGADRIVVDFGDSNPIVCQPHVKVDVIREHHSSAAAWLNDWLAQHDVDGFDHKPQPMGPQPKWAKVWTQHEVIANGIPDDTNVFVEAGGARILVMGDVGKNVTLVALGGSARIDILGSVGDDSRIGVAGGSAQILITEPTGQCEVTAQGGGARIECKRGGQAHAVASGGSSEVKWL